MQVIDSLQLIHIKVISRLSGPLPYHAAGGGLEPAQKGPCRSQGGQNDDDNSDEEIDDDDDDDDDNDVMKMRERRRNGVTNRIKRSRKSEK
ncbi:hypothetical protein PoB_006708600 [Plakobranchus ocellatus]|uniref:Uncharacterized protein n=1 Tax=Plakobranchus ocellatus TaxID=259542 RepID=A0AAV4D951_9GAST|nr:hypothetical protein PoB_006708600 [Plakobranchus ocellatus]